MGADGSKESSSRTHSPAAGEPGLSERPTPDADVVYCCFSEEDYDAEPEEAGDAASSGVGAAAEKASTVASLGGAGSSSGRKQPPADASARAGYPSGGGGGGGGGGGSLDDHRPPAEPERLSEIEEIENLIVTEYQKPSISSGTLSRDRSDSTSAGAKLSPRAASDRRDLDAGPATADVFDPLRFKDANRSPRRNDSRSSTDRKSTPEIVKTSARNISSKPEPQYNEDEVELLVSIERDLIH